MNALYGDGAGWGATSKPYAELFGGDGGSVWGKLVVEKKSLLLKEGDGGVCGEFTLNVFFKFRVSPLFCWFNSASGEGSIFLVIFSIPTGNGNEVGSKKGTSIFFFFELKSFLNVNKTVF